MISQRKLEANRLNAQKSTGPVTAQGKAISSRNALKTGKYAKVHQLGAPPEFDRAQTLLEAQTEIAELTKEFARTFQPATPDERRYVKTLATAEWSIRRFEEIFGMAVIAIVKSAKARSEAGTPRLALVPRRKAAPAEMLESEAALPPAA